MKILFLAANPRSSSRLNLGKEVQEIEDGLRRSKLSDQFQLVQRWEVRPRDLRRALLEENPDIVHFSGHGKGKAGLVIVDNAEQPKPATGEALAGLFRQFPNIKCVLLNACYAEVQAKAIVRHIDYVIGMKDTILDDAAIAFTTGFYDGLGYGINIEDAFELGRNAILWELASFSDTTRQMIPVDFVQAESPENLPEHLKPTLLKKAAIVTQNVKIQPINNDSVAISQNPIQKYRERIKEYLADRRLTPIEKFQLATLAKELGISESEANNILQVELQKIEQAKENYQTVLRQTIEQGYYPFNAKIQQQLKDLQTSLDLIDSEVTKISRPILKQAEVDYQKQQQIEIYVQSSGFSETHDYCWQKIAKYSQEQVNQPSLVKKVKVLLETQAYSIFIGRESSKLILLVTGMKASKRKDYRGRTIRNSIALIDEDNEENERKIRGLAVLALEEKLENEIDSAIKEGGEYGFVVSYEKINNLIQDSLQKELIKNF